MSFSTSPTTFAHKAQLGHCKPIPMIFPAGTAPSLESALSRTTISCSQCQQPVVPDSLGNNSPPNLSQIMWLPDTDRLLPTSVVFHPESDVNKGAGNHPCVAAMASSCGCLVFCMPMTSFRDGGIMQKFSKASNPQKYYESYIPLAEFDTPATHSKGVLEYTGTRMKRQSYVHLEFGYWIERSNLRTKVLSALTYRSLETVKQAYAEAETQRQRNGGSEAKARLARCSRSPSPPSSWRSSRSTSPPMAMAFPSASQGWLPPSPPPSPPTFVLAPRGNAAITVQKSPSWEKVEAMSDSWR